MKSTLLFVDEVGEGGMLGSTTHLVKIRYNLQKINTKNTSGFFAMMGTENLSTLVDCAGRYIFLVTGSDDKLIMTFFDCENDIDNAIAFCANFLSGYPDLINMFLERFDELKPKYNQNFSQYDLRVSVPPD